MRLPGGGRMPFRAFVVDLYKEYEKNEVSDSAAQLSYYLLFALFPFLFFLVTLAAYLPLAHSVDDLLGRIRALVPGDAMSLIDQHVKTLVSHGRPRLLTLGLVISLWSASRGVDAVRRALNAAYDVTETRPYWKTQVVALAVTIIGAVLLSIGVALLIAGGKLGFWAAAKIGFGSEYVLVLRSLRWPVTALLIATVAACTYYFLPDVRQRFKFITPGSAAGTLAWLAATWGFGEYAGAFGTYNVTYGSIGGVIILLTWLYLSGLIFLVGGEINAVLEHHSRTGKAEGAREEGQPAESASPAAAATLSANR
jgi:membrane protein